MTELETWQQEIESLSAGRIILVRVETSPADNTLRIPPDFPGRPIVVQLLQRESFVRQFIQAHALNVNYSGDEGAFHFILLNQARAADWEGIETSLLAHEYGHIWLAVQGYRSPAFAGECIATATGDIVQHILIRQETARRGFDYLAFWKRTHDAWLARESGETAPPELDPCGRLLLIAEWVDAKLAFTESAWTNRDAYFRLLAARHPRLQPVVESLAQSLSALDLWDRSLYQMALHRVAAALSRTL